VDRREPDHLARIADLLARHREGDGGTRAANGNAEKHLKMLR
jgi:hypothetical protein